MEEFIFSKHAIEQMNSRNISMKKITPDKNFIEVSMVSDHFSGQTPNELFTLHSIRN